MFRPFGFDSTNEYVKKRKQMGPVMALDGKIRPTFAGRTMHWSEAERDKLPHMVTLKVLGTPKIDAIAGWFDHHAQEIIDFENRRSGLVRSGQSKTGSDGYSRVKGASRSAFLQELLEKYGHEQCGNQVAYNENNDGFIHKHKRDLTREDKTFIDTRSEEKAALTRQEDGRSFMRSDLNMEALWEIRSIPLMTIRVQYDNYVKNNYTPAVMFDRLTELLGTDDQEVRNLVEMLCDAVEGGQLPQEVAEELGVDYSGLTRFLRRARVKIPNFAERWNDALDTGMEAFSQEVILKMNRQVGVLRDLRAKSDGVIEDEEFGLMPVNPKVIMSMISTESYLMNQTLNNRQKLQMMSKLSRYYVGPSAASLVNGGTGGGGATINLNFSAPVKAITNADKGDVLDVQVKQKELPSFLKL
jgi:hypothetical protein